MNKKIIAILSAIIVFLGGGIVVNQFGGNYLVQQNVIMGSSSRFVSAMATSTFDNATTTSEVPEVGLINQFVGTEGIENGNLCIQAKGGTATSTLNIRQMGSYDLTNFFDVGSSTDSIISTTTIGLDSKVIVFDPGTATTTGKCWNINVAGYKGTRFIVNADNLRDDSTDGVKAYITWNPIDKIVR